MEPCLEIAERPAGFALFVSETDRSFPASKLEMTPLCDFQTWLHPPVWPALFLSPCSLKPPVPNEPQPLFARVQTSRAVGMAEFVKHEGETFKVMKLKNIPTMELKNPDRSHSDVMWGSEPEGLVHIVIFAVRWEF
ncbi:hypothetical protein L596_029978 [Steinernema carpocapsae]|uniref:Uncharacterized protein n=1 Tax=Steinernema carpocapsae TaxID=34508 RepID=A0A4U5LRD5_STECR|nr:hypothetical protein L596_029978 [Steinernema carpocapsae]